MTGRAFLLCFDEDLYKYDKKMKIYLVHLTIKKHNAIIVSKLTVR